MTQIYIEPHPSARLENAPISFYLLMHGNGQLVSMLRYRTLKEAIDVARGLGFYPLVACVRIPEKSNRNHWQPADRITLSG